MSDDDDAYDKLMHEIVDARSGSPKKSRKKMDEEYSFKRKYETALKLLLGMAMGRYRYDPNAKKMMQLPRSCKTLTRWGMK